MLGRAAIKFKYSPQYSAPLVKAGTQEIGSFSKPSARRIRFRTEIHKFTNSRAPTTGSVQGIQDYMPLDCRRFAPRMPKNAAKSAPSLPRKTLLFTGHGRGPRVRP
jgi:hypothetical protein